ncbi:hypothetical protein FO519_000109 [Halicephalobus sp. NKZ332]|nr:hypothetical protein FO519_000109 [Halicephalobus sp. NKZ332]
MKSSMVFVLLMCFCFVGAFRLPSFVESAPKDAQDKYIKIVTSDDDPAKKMAQIDDLMKTQKQDIQQAYAEFKNNMAETQQRFGNSVAVEMENMKNKVSFI